jgi:hypothetical protein
MTGMFPEFEPAAPKPVPTTAPLFDTETGAVPVHGVTRSVALIPIRRPSVDVALFETALTLPSETATGSLAFSSPSTDRRAGGLHGGGVEQSIHGRCQHRPRVTQRPETADRATTTRNTNPAPLAGPGISCVDAGPRFYSGRGGMRGQPRGVDRVSIKSGTAHHGPALSRTVRSVPSHAGPYPPAHRAA